MATPEEEFLENLYKIYGKDLDGGWLEVSTSFAKTCFNEIKALGDKAKVADIYKYIAAMHHVTVKRIEEQLKKHLAEISKLH